MFRLVLFFSILISIVNCYYLMFYLLFMLFNYLGYYVAWIRDDIVKKTNCLSTNPSWMGDRRKKLEHLKMRDIFLPGTHDSAAYAKHKNSQLELIVDKYTITQVINNLI